MRNYYILMPDSKTTMLLYQELKNAEIKCTMAPIPREADACCGVAILYYDFDDRSEIEKIIEESGLVINKFWDCENKNNPNRNKFC